MPLPRARPRLLRRAWSWLWSPLPWVARANGECPACGQPVVLAPSVMMGNSWTGPMAAPRTTEEAVAACSEHGRPPFNDASRAAAAAWEDRG